MIIQIHSIHMQDKYYTNCEGLNIFKRPFHCVFTCVSPGLRGYQYVNGYFIDDPNTYYTFTAVQYNQLQYKEENATT